MAGLPSLYYLCRFIDFFLLSTQGVILICDACDKGFHAGCHKPPVPADTDQSLPWICSACQAEGYRVQPPNRPEAPVVMNGNSGSEKTQSTPTSSAKQSPVKSLNGEATPSRVAEQLTSANG